MDFQPTLKGVFVMPVCRFNVLSSRLSADTMARLFVLTFGALSILAAGAGLSGCASHKPVEAAVAAPVTKPLPASLEEAVNSDRRSDKNRPRDQYRHPLETLQFFEIKPDQTVIEISPATGWYTEILAPYLAGYGHYVAAVRNKDLSDEGNADLKAWLGANADIASRVTMVEFNAESGWNLGAPNSADRVLTFRNVHNWMKHKNEAAIFKAFFTVLKPGGILGVVEHRAGKKQKETRGEKGYMQEKAVIAMAKKAGFKLVRSSEINANPKDTKNYPEGVWTLPPTLKLGDKDREKYLAIGESDRMTLKFVKPLQ
jgi:predicted methyltransferase